MLAFTGIRKGEALALTWEDIDFSKKTINITKTVSVDEFGFAVINPPKTRNGIRLLPADNETMDILMRWKTEQEKDISGLKEETNINKWLVFSKITKNRPLNASAPRNFFASFCKKYNLRFIKIHGFRHTHCTLFFEAGVPLPDVRDRLGHGSISITVDIYNHITRNKQQKTLDSFVSYFSNK